MGRTIEKKLLLLTLVHPDFLPPVYAVAQTLRDEGYEIHILTFDSYVTAEIDLGKGIVVESAGRHHNLGLQQRLAIRRKYTARAKELAKAPLSGIISFCAFTFLCGLKIRKKTPLAYHALEVADFIPASIKRSPLSQINNLLAIRRAHKAGLVTTPSVQRSEWLAKRAGLKYIPPAILNAPYLATGREDDNSRLYGALVPANISSKKVILYTGAVNHHLCIMELVAAFCTLNDERSALVLTGMKDNAYCNEIREYVAKSTSTGSIKLLPYVTRAEMLALQANAQIGVCLAREYDHDEESKMMAPNKVGEYLAKGLYLLGVDTEYMQQFKSQQIAALASEPTVEKVQLAMTEALLAVAETSYKDRIRDFVTETYCMQQQIAPLSAFLKK